MRKELDNLYSENAKRLNLQRDSEMLTISRFEKMEKKTCYIYTNVYAGLIKEESVKCTYWPNLN